MGGAYSPQGGAQGPRGATGATGATGPAGNGAASGPAQWLVQEGGGTIQAAFLTVSVTQALPDMVAATQPRTGMRRFSCVPSGGGVNQLGCLSVLGVVQQIQGAEVSGRVGATVPAGTFVFAGIGLAAGLVSHNPVTAPLNEQGIANAGGNWFFVSAGGVLYSQDLGASFAYDPDDLLDYDIIWDENTGDQRYRVRNPWSGADTGWVTIPAASKLLLTPGATVPPGAYRDAVLWCSRGTSGGAVRVDGVHLRGQQGAR